MEESPKILCHSHKKGSLYRRFLDSSSDDTSSSASISETTSTEVARILDSVKNENFALSRNQECNNTRTSSVHNTQPVNIADQNKSTSTDESYLFGLKTLGPSRFINMKEKTDLNKNSKTCPELEIVQPTYEENQNIDDQKVSVMFSGVKMMALVIIWILCTIVLIEKKERVRTLHQISIPSNETKSYWIHESSENGLISVVMEGAFLPPYYANLSSRSLSVWIEIVELEFQQKDINTHNANISITEKRTASPIWNVPIVSEELIDVVPDLLLKEVLHLDNATCRNMSTCSLRLRFQTNLQSSFPVAIEYDVSPIDMEYGVICAAGLLMMLYITIIFDILHRTLAAMMVATSSVAVLAALNERPSISELATWIDFETLLLLFSMMVLVAVFSETGVFDYLSVCTYQLTNGRIWPLVITLCLLTAFLSSLVDNVTTALLVTPVTIRLCEVMELNPVLVLMAIMIFSNLGGALTPVGDPPNVIVASHADVKAAGVNFGVFILHMGVGLILVSVVVMIQLKIMFSKRNVLRSDDPLDMQDLKHEIAIWERAAASISTYSKDEIVVRETLLKRVRRLLSELKMRLKIGRGPSHSKYSRTLEDLKAKYPIKDRNLLFKSGFALSFVIIVFFLHSIPDLHLSLGCTAFMGALLLLILAERPNLEGVLARVEWSTLLFFASLFILMEAVTRLRLIDWIGHRTELMILSVNEEFRLPVSIILILWISAGVSAFVDNIPLTSMMIRIVTSISRNPELGLPLTPHVWALSFGACVGGIATLIGSSSNVVCAGIAEQHGYRFSFVQYSRIGFPVAIVSLIVVTFYLLIAHVVLQWND